MTKFYSLLFVLLLSVLCVRAQEELLFTQISTMDGLSQNTVRSVFVDNKGYIWFGTLDGLVRYDGTRFITHRPELGFNTNLSDQRIREISEDKDGYLWIRTYDNSYSCYNNRTEQFVDFEYDDRRIKLQYTNYLETNDGYIWLWGNQGCIKIVKDETRRPIVDLVFAQNDHRLTGSNVRFVYQDSNQAYWIGCAKGLNRIDTSGEITKFFDDDSLGRFRKVLEVDGIIYFLSERVIYRYNVQKQMFLEPIEARSHTVLYDMQKAYGNQLFVSTRDNELLSLNVRTGVFSDFPFKMGKPFDSPPQMIVDERQGVWIYDYSGRVIYHNPITGTYKPMQLIAPEIAAVIDDGRYNVLIDSNGIFWITTYGNGLYRYDESKDELTNYTYKKGTNSPASNYILSVTEDRFGNIWMGCEYAGAFKVTKKKYKVEYLKPEKQNVIGTSNNVKVIFQDSEKNVWVGTKNGSLYLYDRDLNFKRCIAKGINPYTVIEDAKGRLWVGTKGNGIYLYDRQTFDLLARFVNQEDDSASLCFDSVFDIIQDNEGRIWVATFGGGMDLVDETNGSFSFRHFFNDSGNLSYVRCLLQDSNGHIWAGSYEGLISFIPKDLISNPKAYTKYTYNPGHSVGLNCNDIKSIFEDSRKQLWVGTAGGGVNLFDRHSLDKQGAFIKYARNEGLPSNIVTSIMESKDGVIWVSTESGLVHLDKSKNTFLSYQFSGDLYGNIYNENACLLKHDGEMLWGTLDGLLVLDPTSIEINSIVPMVELTDLYIHDQRVDANVPKSAITESIGSTREIVLEHDQNTFTINFACLDLTDPDRNKYSYILESYDRDWSAPNSNNWATYKNMPDGDYVFKVRGANADGEWNDAITTCKIVVLPPIWKTTYAIVTYILLILSLAYIFIRFLIRINSLNNAVKMEKQLTDYKLRFFTNISHEFRTPLTLIKGAIERLNDIGEVPGEVSKNVKLLNRNTQQMSRLIDQLLEFRKLQNNVLTLNLEKTDIRDFVLNAYYTFKEIAFQKNIDYQFEGIENKWDIYVDRNKLEKIIFNLLTNAFKFTPANGSITCQLIKDKENDKCIISVIDTGVGVPKDKQELLFSRFMKLNTTAEGTGIGLELVKEFTETHKGSVKYEANPGGGSVFTVTLPTDRNVYRDVKFLDEDIEDAEVIEQPDYNEDHAIKRPSAPHQWKILIIDDNYDIREYLSEELSHHCYVEVAEDGKIGLEKARSINPTLIICDVKMPEMDGLQVTRLLKDDFETSHIPVILLTALSSDTIKLQGSESGADEYIMKPFSMKYLISRVYSLIDQREKLKKHFSIDIDVKKAIISEDEKDQKFYDMINQIVDKNLSDPEFTVTQFTKEAKLSRTIFYKKVKGLTGYSPNELIKIKRMKKAAELLLEDKYNVSEVSWKVGIEDPFYFSKCFKAQFGCAPSKYGIAEANEANGDSADVENI